jgi:hypothetical protein
MDTPSTVMSSLTHPLFQPFERFISRYAELEGVVVNEEVRRLPRPRNHPPPPPSLDD